MNPLLSAVRTRLHAIPLLGPVFTRVSGLERTTLAIVGLSAAALYFFLALAGEVMEGETRGLDETILLALRNPADRSDPLGPPWLEESMRDLTALGGTTILVLVTLAVIAYLLLVRRRLTALMVLGSIAGGALLSSTVKILFDRARPDLVPHGMAVYSASFPSGHSMMSAVVYLTLGALLARAQVRQRVKVYLLGLAAFVTVIVGLSRLYLGVHWPTDVLGGWALGAAWAAGCWLVMLWLQTRGEMEPEAATAAETAEADSASGAEA
ncbi:phosphatase PAP2 family protein [Roseixanthobacter liquoris]|uniref:phosphatase PAP2 family protein n=1 Tax=Roseixanthobacter liquoris TaxID=3119921 RepID=UPI0037262BC9